MLYCRSIVDYKGEKMSVVHPHTNYKSIGLDSVQATVDKNKTSADQESQEMRESYKF